MTTDYDKKRWGELEISYLIIDTKNFIVFIDSQLDIDWITSDEYDKNGPKDSDKHAKILNGVALLECKPNGHFADKIQLDFKRLLGEALARGLAAEYDSANQILEQSEIYLTQRGRELSRTWYLSTAGVITSVVLATSIVAWPFRNLISNVWGSSFHLYATVMVFGALGALLSIIMRTGKEHFDCHAGKSVHQLESAYRIVAGMLSSFFVTMAVTSGFILPTLSTMTNLSITLYFIGFVSGMSERIVPSITTKIENVANKGVTKKSR
ncbi:hypothetical protein [Marinomonas sp.]|uniref:hypothetical protein n=1 Tax=Marinomonas sp. TaxID=1904862 RepID=UPI003BAA3ECF